MFNQGVEFDLDRYNLLRLATSRTFVLRVDSSKLCHLSTCAYYLVTSIYLPRNIELTVITVLPTSNTLAVSREQTRI
jgi:hypothetical protein